MEEIPTRQWRRNNRQIVCTKSEANRKKKLAYKLLFNLHYTIIDYLAIEYDVIYTSEYQY